MNVLFIGDSITNAVGDDAGNAGWAGRVMRTLVDDALANVCGFSAVGSITYTTADAFAWTHAFNGSTIQTFYPAAFHASGTGTNDVASVVNPADARLKPDIIIDAPGRNNCTDATEAVASVAYQGHLLRYMRSLNATARLVLAEVIPHPTSADDGYATAHNTEQANLITTLAGEGIEVRRLLFNTGGISWVKSEGGGGDFATGGHPNAQGYTKMADYAVPRIREYAGYAP